MYTIPTPQSWQQVDDYNELIQSSERKTKYYEPIAKVLSFHGANDKTKALQVMVENVISKLPVDLAERLIQALKEINSPQILETSLIWQQVQTHIQQPVKKSSISEQVYAYNKLRRSSISSHQHRETIILILSYYGATSETMALQTMVESVISKLPVELAERLVQELMETSSPQMLEDSLIWKQIQAYLELIQNFPRSRTCRKSALILSYYVVNSKTQALQTMIESVSIIETVRPDLSNRLIQALEEINSPQMLMESSIWREIQEYFNQRK